MLIYTKPRFIRAHQNPKVSYENHSYDRYVRTAICKECGTTIGEQVKYPDFEKEFTFKDRDMNKYSFCPYCGKQLKEE